MDKNIDLRLKDLDAAVSSWEFAGPGNLDSWEPGEDVDYDDLARDILAIAIDLVRVRWSV